MVVIVGRGPANSGAEISLQAYHYLMITRVSLPGLLLALAPLLEIVRQSRASTTYIFILLVESLTIGQYFIMHFRDVPSDLMIILVDKYISPDDVEAFSLSCRGVYNIANSRLRKHRELSNSYSFLIVDLRNFSTGNEQWKKLYQCCSDPWIARYPKHLHIIAPSHSSFTSDRAPIDQAIGDMIRKSAPFNGFMTTQEIGDWSVSANATHDAMAAICLSFLPNLYTFKLEYEGQTTAGWRYDRVTSVLQRSLNQERTRDFRGHLSHLTNVKLHASDGAAPLLEWFRLFLKLPSMRNIEGLNVLNLEQPHTAGPRDSKVTSIALHRSLILAYPFSIVLSRLESLQKFIYTHCPHPYYCTPSRSDPHIRRLGGDEPQRIVNALSDHARDSLQTLHLSFSCEHCAGPVEYLQGFNSLKSIILSASLLFRRDDTVVDLVKLLPSTVDYLKVVQDLPSNANERSAHQKQQCELLTALPRIRESFGGSLRYQTLSIVKIDFEKNYAVSGVDGWHYVAAKYTVHPGPGGALRSLKPDEYLEWMECGEDSSLAVQDLTTSTETYVGMRIGG